MCPLSPWGGGGAALGGMGWSRPAVPPTAAMGAGGPVLQRSLRPVGSRSRWHPMDVAWWDQWAQPVGEGRSELMAAATVACLQTACSLFRHPDPAALRRGAGGDPSVSPARARLRLFAAVMGDELPAVPPALLLIVAGDPPVTAAAAPRWGGYSATRSVNPGLIRPAPGSPHRAEEAQGGRKGSRGRARDNADGRFYLTSSRPVLFLPRSPLRPQHPLLSALRCDPS